MTNSVLMDRDFHISFHPGKMKMDQRAGSTTETHMSVVF